MLRNNLMVLGIALALGCSITSFAGSAYAMESDTAAVSSIEQGNCEYNKALKGAEKARRFLGIFLGKKSSKSNEASVVKTDNVKPKNVSKSTKFSVKTDKAIENSRSASSNLLKVVDELETKKTKPESESKLAEPKTESLSNRRLTARSTENKVSLNSRTKNDEVVVPVSNLTRTTKFNDVNKMYNHVTGGTQEVVFDSGSEKFNDVGDYQVLDYRNPVSNTVYTRMGHATVIVLPRGEKVERVTMGDRQHFGTNVVYDKASGCWQIYIQPVQENVITNMIVCTDRRMYNVHLDVSDSPLFWKPFAKWINLPEASNAYGLYDSESIDLGVIDIKSLNMRYKRVGGNLSKNADVSVFDDKMNTTYVKLDNRLVKYSVPVFMTRLKDGSLKVIPSTMSRNNFVLSGLYDNVIVHTGNRYVEFSSRHHSWGEE